MVRIGMEIASRIKSEEPGKAQRYLKEAFLGEAVGEAFFQSGGRPPVPCGTVAFFS